MKIAILVPTRERLNKKLTLLNSILCTVNDINNITVYFGVDVDDPKRSTILKMAKAFTFLKIVDIPAQPNVNVNINKIWNQLATVATEEIFGYIGDDMVFRTNNWDVEIINEFSGSKLPKDKIKCVHCDDGFHKHAICINAFMHRAYYDTIGYFVRDEFLVNWSDQWMFQVYKSLDRLTYRGDIYIEHEQWMVKQLKQKINITPDNVTQRMIDRDNSDNKARSDGMWDKLGPERDKEVAFWEKKLNIKANYKVVENSFRNK